MQTLTVALGDRSYPIHVGQALLGDAALIIPHLRQAKAAIVTNTTVAALYLQEVAQPLRQAGVEVIEIILPDGEQYKDWPTLNLIFDALLRQRCERSTTLIALGGGVVGDITGFAAACYQRGVPFLQMPTSLLAQVDSSVGGKTAINHPLGKNMLGAFHQPMVVLADTDTLNTLADTDTLNTLPDRELSAGLAEVIKYGSTSSGCWRATRRRLPKRSAVHARTRRRWLPPTSGRTASARCSTWDTPAAQPGTHLWPRDRNRCRLRPVAARGSSGCRDHDGGRAVSTSRVAGQQ